MNNDEDKKSGEEGADFSHYFEMNGSEPATDTSTQTFKKPGHIKLIISLVVSVIALTATAIITFTNLRANSKPAASYDAPPGYNYVRPSNEPPRIEKIKS